MSTQDAMPIGNYKAILQVRAPTCSGVKCLELVGATGLEPVTPTV